MSKDMDKLGSYLSGQRFTGAGKALDTPTKERAGRAKGEKDRQAAVNRSTKVNPDGDYGGNVVGPRSKPVEGI